MSIKRLTLSILSAGMAVTATVGLLALLSQNTDASAAYAMPNAGTGLMADRNAITPSVIASVTVGTGAEGAGVNSTTNLIYLANWGTNSDQVSVIDGANNAVVATTVALSP
jgi:DNA-binding beta-propeller fold protein YncE